MPEKYVFKIENGIGSYKIAGGLINLNRSSYSFSNNAKKTDLIISVPGLEDKKIPIDNDRNLKLGYDGEDIVLFYNRKIVRGPDQQKVVIDENDILGVNKENIIQAIKSGEKATVGRVDIKGSDRFAVRISYYVNTDKQGNVLKHYALLDFLPPTDETRYFVIEKGQDGSYKGYIGHIAEDEKGDNQITHTPTDAAEDGSQNFTYSYELGKVQGISPIFLEENVDAAENVLPILAQYEKDGNSQAAENLASFLADNGTADNLLPVLSESKATAENMLKILQSDKAAQNVKPLLSDSTSNRNLKDLLAESDLMDECMVKLFEDEAQAESVGGLLKNSFVSSIMPLIKPAIKMLKPLACPGYGTSGDSGVGYQNDQTNGQTGGCHSYSNLKFAPGEKMLNDVGGGSNRNEAKVTGGCESVSIAEFSELGCFFLGDKLYIRDHTTNISKEIPKEFHFLKIVKDENDNYKLTLSNNLGNLFYKHMQFSQGYTQLLSKHKFIDIDCVKDNADFHKYYHNHTHSPLFMLKKEVIPGINNGYYGAGIYDISDMSKKIGLLIDEFAYYKDGKLHYVDYHRPDQDDRICEADLRIKFENGEAYLCAKCGTDGNHDTIINPIAINQDNDVFDYLAYYYLSI